MLATYPLSRTVLPNLRRSASAPRRAPAPVAPADLLLSLASREVTSSGPSRAEVLRAVTPR